MHLQAFAPSSGTHTPPVDTLLTSLSLVGSISHVRPREFNPDDFLPRFAHVVHRRGTYLLIQAFDLFNGRIFTTKKPGTSEEAYQMPGFNTFDSYFVILTLASSSKVKITKLIMNYPKNQTGYGLYSKSSICIYCKNANVSEIFPGEPLMMLSEFVLAVSNLLAEPFLLTTLRVLILAAVIKTAIRIVRDVSALTLAFALWLSVLVLIVVVNDSGQSAIILIRFDSLVAFGVMLGVGYTAYARLT